VAPQGGAFDYGNHWAGRYSIQRIALEGVALSPAVGVQVSEKVSIGFGASIVHTTFGYEFAINRSVLPVPSDKDGQAKVTNADDIGVAGFAGLQWEYSDGGVFGVVYRSKMEVNLEGDVHITRLLPMGRERQTDIEIEWDNPQVLEIGIRQRLTDDWSLVANADWENWSEFGNNVFTFDGSTAVTIERKWQNTFKLGAGAIWKGEKQAVGFGVSYDSSPVTDRNRTMDLPLDKQVGMGFSYVRDKDKKFNWALSANLTWFGDGKVDQTIQGERIVGEFDTNYALFLAGTMTYRFGRS
jgi:long-chain fatty acid transport protein